MNVLDLYPVGSIIELVSTNDPNNSIGGTWTLDDSNSILVGKDSDYFSGTTGSTVGSDTATCGYPLHNHTNTCRGICTISSSSYGNFTASSTVKKIANGGRCYEYYGPATFTTNSQGSGNSHENRMKSLQVMRWIRTA